MTELIFGISGMLVGVVGMILAVINASRNKKRDDINEGKEDGVVLTELGYIKAGVDDLKKDNREIRAEMQALHERITRNEESTKQAHKRINELSNYHKPN